MLTKGKKTVFGIRSVFDSQNYWINVYVGEVCNFLSSISAQQNLKQQMDQCDSSVLLATKGKYILKVSDAPKRGKEKRSALPNFGSSFYMFFLLPLSLPCVNWARQEGCLFYLRFSLRPSSLLFSWFFPFFVFQPFWTPFSYSNYLANLGQLTLSL